MKFDKSKVYTALNADDLKAGSLCFFANCLDDLMGAVKSGKKAQARRFTKAFACDYVARFCDNYGSNFVLAYLVEPPAEPKYKPFESVDTAMEAIKKHGGWIKHKTSKSYVFVYAYDESTVYFLNKRIALDYLFGAYVFADDGSPCGKLVDK